MNDPAPEHMYFDGNIKCENVMAEAVGEETTS
jgi:hypothetical protein